MSRVPAFLRGVDVDDQVVMGVNGGDAVRPDAARRLALLKHGRTADDGAHVEGVAVVDVGAQYAEVLQIHLSFAVRQAVSGRAGAQRQRRRGKTGGQPQADQLRCAVANGAAVNLLVRLDKGFVYLRGAGGRQVPAGQRHGDFEALAEVAHV